MSDCVFCGGSGEVLRQPEENGPITFETCGCVYPRVFRAPPSKEQSARAMAAAIAAIEKYS